MSPLKGLFLHGVVYFGELVIDFFVVPDNP
jgi:hypothetical protein